MNDTLKAAGRIGAELGAAKAEVEALREALRPFAVFEAVRSKQGGCTPKSGTVWAVASAGEEAEITVEHLQAAVAALSPQPEPTDTYTATDMATAAAQGFRDGQAAVEPAVAQDERETSATQEILDLILEQCRYWHGRDEARRGGFACLYAAAKEVADNATRPAQTEQQPIGWFTEDNLTDKSATTYDRKVADRWRSKGWPVHELYAAPIAQTAPQGKFRMGDLVKKSTGSEWVGRVVGWYSTEQTKEGYAVESSAHRNSVQIYPAKALEAVE